MHALVPSSEPFRPVRITQNTNRRRLSALLARDGFRCLERRLGGRFLCVGLEVLFGDKVGTGLVRRFAGSDDVGVRGRCGRFRCVGRRSRGCGSLTLRLGRLGLESNLCLEKRNWRDTELEVAGRKPVSEVAYKDVRVGHDSGQSLAQDTKQERPAGRQPSLCTRSDLRSNQDPLDPLKHTVRDCRIRSQHQPGLQPRPQTRHPILRDDLPRGIKQSRVPCVVFRRVELLSSRDDGDGDRKDLGERAGESAEE